MNTRPSTILARLLLLLAVPLCSLAQPLDPSLWSGLRWRLVGPFRGGWATCVEGIPEQPDTFYFGAAAGGVWKTDDAGRTWTPLFEHESSASIGALAVAPSRPSVLYVGTGQVEARYDLASGSGVFRSDDGGKSWRHAGLAATGAIGRLVVDPRDPDIVLAAALGHYYGPNRERGVFRSQDGGRTWSQTLFVNDDTGAVDLASDPQHPEMVFAAAWQARNYPWLSYFKPVAGPGSAVYKSSDGGRSWKKISGGGWPSGALGRIGLAAAPGGRVYALVDAQPALAALERGRAEESAAGLYRSDDGGATWLRVNHEDGLASSYFGRITADPRNPDVLSVVGQSIRRTEDGGKSFHIVKGAPGGDDYHFLWINPAHPDHMATASDQGTVVTVNGGRTWSDWYNQPTGQFYHVTTDERFPYWIYSGQQDSGTVGIASRGDYGAVTYREWRPVGGEERGWDVPDPADPETVFGTGLGGTVTRFDGRTGQVANVSPVVESTYGRRPTDVRYRYTWISPLVASPRPPHALYFGSQVLFRSTDRGQSWTAISGDLTGAVPGTQGCQGEVTVVNAGPCGFGVIFSIALSARDEREIWVGTDSGRIAVTRDGGARWQDVTPGAVAAWSKISSLDVSALEPGTAYAAVDRHRLDDFSPHAYRTRDFGRSWTPIAAGIPSGQFVTVVRADPIQRGLLYAGTSAGVFVSFDDGDRWQPLEENLPTVWVGDLAVHGDDLVAATQGRAIWVLDDISILRETGQASSAPVHLFRPAPAVRVRANENKDTPLPPETPQGENPPAGAVVDYFLKAPAGNVRIEIVDARGAIVRAFASGDRPEETGAHRYFTREWVRPQAAPSAEKGHHRLVWDLRFPRPKSVRSEYSIAAVWGRDTPVEPDGVLALPGAYTVRLTVDGRSFTQPLTLRPDPRVKVTEGDLDKQFALATRVADAMNRDFDALQKIRALRKRIDAGGHRAERPAAALDEKLRALEDGAGPGAVREESLSRLGARLASAFLAIESADAAPTAEAAATSEELTKALARQLERWEEIQQKELPELDRGPGKAESPKS